MPTYLGLGGTGSANGSWGNPAHWSGGIPNSVGAIANFSTSSTSGTTALIDLPGTITVGVMNFTSTGDLGYAFVNGNFIFNNGAAAAELNVNVTAVSNPISFSLPITLTSNLDVDIVVSGSDVAFSGPISGSGLLTLTGLGILDLNGANTFTGGIAIQGGILDAAGDSSLGSGDVSLANNGAFRSAGTINQTFSTSGADGSPAGSGQLLAAASTTMTLSGSLNHLSQSTITFGSATDTGTIVASFSSIADNAINSSYRITGGTVRFGNAFNAANLFSHPGSGLTEFTGGGILDTNGFATTISNLDFDAGTIRSSAGILNVTVNDSAVGVNAQTGTIEGTAGADTFTVNVTSGFALSSLTLLNWTAGTDLITLNGNSAGNSITGSTGRDTINGFAGNDTLIGNGGIDTISGGDGDDTIVLIATNAGSLVDGGANTDTLQIGGTVSIGSIAGFEAIGLVGGATLSLTASQFSLGLTTDATLSGTGTILITMSPGDVFFATGMTAAPGSAINFNITGSSGIDVIKCNLNVANTIDGGDGVNQIRGGSQGDTINGGIGNDKIMGLGGADLLTGGAGSDQFRYLFSTDAGTGAGADQILDFISGSDKLDFRTLDANPFTAGRQALTFVGTSAFVNNGIAQVRYTDLGADLRVDVDLDGNGVADMQILLIGSGAQVLSGADFLL
ncbi:MAG: beta strand repeat-containing protein [Novosphingobium sp.]